MTFSLRYDYEVFLVNDPVKTFQVRDTGYWYEIGDASGREIIAFHWHPASVSSMTFPHLHLSSRLGMLAINDASSIALGEMHIPTGFIEVADLVRLLIVEFGVEPRRANWESILQQG